MTDPTLEWYREQSEYNRRFYERLQAAWPDHTHDWKITALFYSGLHRANYHFVKLTGRAPGSHFERNQRIRRELPQVRSNYMDLYMMSMRARYRDGLRTKDSYRRRALALLTLLEKALPFE